MQEKGRRQSKMKQNHLKSINHKKVGLSSGAKMKVSVAITNYFGESIKTIFSEKMIASFWVTKGTVKIVIKR